MRSGTVSWPGYRRSPIRQLSGLDACDEPCSGYLWKAAWCFHRARDPAMEDWVITQGLDILHGRAGDVIARIGDLAAAHPPRPGSEHAKIIRTTLHYLDAKQPWMDYPRALANGWPIATGVIEGACRHLVVN